AAGSGRPFVLGPLSSVPRPLSLLMTRDNGPWTRLRLAAAVPGADPRQKPPLLVGQRLDALLLGLGEQGVHPPLLGFAGFLLPQGPASGPLLPPPLEPVRPLPPRGGGRRLLRPFEAGVALREVVAERGVLAAGFQQDQLLSTVHVDE